MAPEIPPVPSYDLGELNARGDGRFPGHVGFQVVAAERGMLQARLDLQPHHLAPNGYLHAAVVITLADTASGYGCVGSLPEGAAGFTTIELKSNFLGTLHSGALACTATQTHGGRSTQVWDAPVTDEATGKTLALFRCTQMILWPRS